MNRLAKTIKGFLFDHLNTRQILAKNAFWLAVSEFVPRIFKFFLAVFTARILGATDYGAFSFALAFASMFLIFSDFGLGAIVIREFSRDPTQEKHFPAVLSLKMLLGFAVLAVTIAGSFLITPDQTIRWAIWILAFYIFFQSLKSLAHALFNARQRMEYEAASNLFAAITLTTFGFFVLLTAPSIISLGFAYAISSFLALIFVFLLLQWRIIPVATSFVPRIWKQFLSLSWPLGFSSFGFMVIGQIDFLTLGFFGQITQNGWYNAAYTIFGIMFLPVIIVYQSFFPVMSRAFRESLEKLQKMYNLQSEIAIFLAFGFLAGGLALAPRIIDYIYDPSFAPANLSLAILSAAAVFSFLAYPLQQILLISNLQKKILIASFAAALANLVLDILLVPQFSLYGTAFATFVTYAVMWALLFRDASFYAPITMFSTSLSLAIFVAALAAGIAYISLGLPMLANFHTLILVFLGGTIYTLAFLGFRFLTSKFFPGIRTVEIKTNL